MVQRSSMYNSKCNFYSLFYNCSICACFGCSFKCKSTSSIISSIISVLAVATNGRIAPLNLTDGVSNPVLINDADLTDLSAQITFYANNSGNPLLIANASTLGALYGKARQTTSADLIVLPASSVIGTTSANPAPFNIQE